MLGPARDAAGYRARGEAESAHPGGPQSISSLSVQRSARAKEAPRWAKAREAVRRVSVDVPCPTPTTLCFSRSQAHPYARAAITHEGAHQHVAAGVSAPRDLPAAGGQAR